MELRIKKRIANGLSKFLRNNVEIKGEYSLVPYPVWDRFGKIREGDYSSMIAQYVGWVYACVKVIVDNSVKVPFNLAYYVGDELRTINSHIFYNLWSKPNRWQTSYEVKSLIFQYLLLSGNAYLYAPSNPFGRPVEILVLPSDRVTPHIDRVGGEDMLLYRFIKDGVPTEIPFFEIVHFKLPNPKNQLVGMSPLEAARREVNINEYMVNYQENLLGNRARPDGTLETEQHIDDDEAERARNRWQQIYGGIDKVGNVAVLGDGLKYKPVSLSSKDLEYLESRKFTMREICAMFGVSLFILGYEEGVNRAHAYTLNRQFQENTIAPLLFLFDLFMTERLLSRYDKRLICKHENNVPSDKEFLLEQEKVDLAQGVVKRNEIRERRGLDPVEGGDDLLVPFNLVPISSVGSAAEETPKSFELETKEFKDLYWKIYIRRTRGEEKRMIAGMRSFFNRQQKVVLSNLKKTKAYSAKMSPEIILFELEGEDKILIEFLLPLGTDFIANGAETMIDDFGLDLVFDLHSPYIQDFLANRQKEWKNIDKTTHDDLRKTIAQGIENGETHKDIAKRIGKVYDDARGYRSNLIARTEVNTCNNLGHYETMRQAGISEKEWISARDGKVRDSHLDNEAQHCIMRDAPFQNGSMYPNEPNCRCVVIPCLEKAIRFFLKKFSKGERQ